MSDEESSTLGRLQDAAIRTVDRVIDDGEQQLEDDSSTISFVSRATIYMKAGSDVVVVLCSDVLCRGR